ncbi:DNA mismatch repair protein msh2-like protein [Thermochaetoides thermophila DSM 1495]|uniref:DNA mismatch repair protein msh2-like protein n=1 Tax=Chaetomium thermophilum (strain DSM 1495 / CBS 144.50 / IMI 039719) TaxID=759272 RepID=G0S2B1_CHATD|nr:DNA mismatch repair protein msh2-like protein [Thermochaetoides thermophila DSM 1495]EGS22144.1 DNA mismatch repair protein msh2-like protein [Thermochaetoides thermophila DSM 1495]
MSSRPELKVDDEHGFIRFFRSLPPVGEDTIRIFDRNDWYTAHGEDANFIARTVYKTTSVVRMLGKNDHTGLPSVTMTVTVFRQFLREALYKLGKRIEIWTSANGRMNWKLAKQASPGNLQDVEDDLGGYGESAPIILAVKISAKASEARTVGVCFADATARELGVSEFLDNDLYSNFESLLIQLGVKECLIQIDKADKDKKDPELAKLRQIIDSCNIAISERPSSDFATKDIEQDLARLLKDERSATMLPQTDLKLAMGSAAALIKYLGVLHDPANFGQFRLYQHDLAQFMKLDAAALKALNLMPGPRDGSKTMSLFGLLNHCKTPLGSRLLAQWLKQPLMDKDEIEKRQQLVEAFANDTELRQTMQEEHLRAVPDLYRLAMRFQRKKANLEDVVRVYQVVIRLPSLLGTLEGVMDEAYRDPLDEAYTNKLRELSDSLAKFQDMVETTVDLDALDNHEFIIKPEFDDSLRIIRKRLDKLRSDMEREFAEAARDLGQERDKKIFLENHKVHGWCMRLTRTEAGCIRNKPKYMECSTQKNGVYFTTKTLQAYRREFDQLNLNYNRTQSGLVSEVVSVAASYVPVLERLAGVLAHLDVIVSFAHCAVHAPTSYVRPKIHPRGEGQTILKEARHPCLEVQDDVQFITNDVELTRDKSSFLIITGPNMGGKSTYIRQIGVIALMAQVGSFVPCSYAELTIFDSILARVGASDSQLKGVSTFMAEMLETANILKSATRESLIIIDELGRGTSTYDGFGLAWAISEHIVQEIGCFALFATHFHELTALADQHPQVRNLHVTAHISGTSTANGSGPRKADTKREVTLLYKVEPGVCDQSFGIHVAELVRFPDKVVRMAKRKADELEDFTTNHEEGADSNVGGVAAEGYSKQDVEEGSALLKDLLVRWKDEVQSAGGMNKAEMVKRLREMVAKDEKLLANPFFQSIKTL